MTKLTKAQLKALVKSAKERKPGAVRELRDYVLPLVKKVVDKYEGDREDLLLVGASVFWSAFDDYTKHSHDFRFDLYFLGRVKFAIEGYLGIESE